MKNFRVLRYSTLSLCLGLSCLGQYTYAQTEPKPIINASLAGYIYDSQSKLALGDVTVQLEAVTHSVKTDQKGFFQFVTGQKLPLSITVSRVGYNRKTISVSQSPVIIELEPVTKDLDEVIVVGYGTQKKISLTNSIASIDGEKLNKRPVSNTQQALQGMLPGVTVQDLGGKPGQSAANIRIRGLTTFNTNSSNTSGYDLSKNNALVIVDGIEQPWSKLNPNDIASISVLKDASSTAIYGSRATNGVILVTTKSAKTGHVIIDYNGYYAVQKSINRPQQMDVISYLQLQQDAYRNAGLAVPARFTDESIESYRNATDRQKYPLPNTWFETLLKTAPQHDHSLSFSGGNEVLKSRLAVRYNKQNGIIDNYGAELADFRLNNDYKATPWLNFTGSINYRYSKAYEPGRDPINNFLHGSMWVVPKYDDGTYGLSTQGNNPLMLIEKSGYKKVSENYLSSIVKADVQLLENLTFTSQFGVRLNFNNTKTFLNAFENRDRNTGIVKSFPINSLTELRDNNSEYTWNNLLTYQLTSGSHHIKALAGYSQIHNYQNNLTAYRERFYSNDITSIGQGADDATKNNNGYDAQYGLRSFFGRLNYDWNGRYLVEFNGRYDGSSRFTGDKQYGFFPSASAGWLLSNEQFWTPIKNWLNEFKLRASWGKTGNQSVDLYSYYSALVAAGYNFSGKSVQGYRLDSYANQQLGWESTQQYDLGLDASFLNNRLAFTLDYYHKVTNDILLNLDIPAVLGLKPSPQNAGSVLNRGWEFAVNYHKRASRPGAFTYQINANLRVNHNEVTDLKGTGPYIVGSDIDPRYIIATGLPINTLWGYKTDGLFQSAEEIKAYGATYATNTQPGDVKYVDLNGDGVINAGDMTAIGNSFPKYTFGLNGGFAFKNFDLDILFQGTAKVDARLSGALAEMGNQEGFTHEIYTANYWTPTHPNASFPRVVKYDLRNVATADRLVVNGSYLRLKNIQLGYTVPLNRIGKVSVSKLRVYLSATNLLTFSKLNEWNLDPEAESGRAVYYPQTALYTFGVNLTL
ncbi:SusC/RagA family TonB-linked outer membrane protein [Sphingobacterium sp. NGMCC 1.201703]|uniref:SusC/RagA family TonB-linked outer membrane protein n=1 Tax=Sphingobacterium sp. NGMCC 1.201703 TaxID=3388657 RepID=UPI0039FD4CF3